MLRAVVRLGLHWSPLNTSLGRSSDDLAFQVPLANSVIGADKFGGIFGITTVRELQQLFCGV